MVLARAFGSLKSRLGTAKLVDGLRTEEQVRFFIDKERALCDRNSHQFSVLVFERCQDRRRDNEHLRLLVRAMRNRLRLSDEVGWFDGGRIVAILPLTSMEGATRVAEDVRMLVRESSGGLETRFSVHTYPRLLSASGEVALTHERTDRQSHWTPPSGGAAAGRDGNSAGSGAEPYDRSEVHGQCACVAPAAELAPVLPRPMPAWKRAMDIAGACTGLLVLTPLFVVVGMLIKCVSKGPVFFRQERFGYLGKPFMCWKLRTMHVDNGEDVHQAHLAQLMKADRPMTKLDARGDPRIIPMGKVLRKTCIDELPQLINVLRGEMSLIGPRPCVRYEAADYLPWQKKRFDAVPGMTGLWQVSGKNKTTFKQMIRWDITYARRISFLGDMGILLRTFPTIVGLVVENVVRKLQRENPGRA